MVTVTVYVPAVLTLIAAVVAAVFQRYVAPPLAVKMVFVPSHIKLVPVILATGIGFMVAVIACREALIQPFNSPSI